ncbi:Zinc finger protein zfs1 [Hondaea fermentalgiana]|uniref:Zinc finger protein zfs1 n=1 Tax=Hondaea fermentalgiana TaxID=2315210 RepID=A0A2R5GQQ4_9STRA|nr:Zinc finger protein zfs1 [Hondaea fermentalgiana]|eukprot:GBG32935.1 Zinc finger protein zfs1 [Hondaea fermentalgiana]
MAGEHERTEETVQEEPPLVAPKDPVGFVCSRRQRCELCKVVVEPGERILRVVLGGPQKQDDADVRLTSQMIWVHRDCALLHGCDLNVGRTVCKHWKRFGSCRYGAQCQFLHPVEQAKAAPIQKRVFQGRRRAVRKDGRVGVLRRFVLDLFGEARLQGGSGVLDIAGGHGELAFELSNLNGVPSCVVDPRPVKLDGFARKLSLGMYHRNLGAGGVAHVSRALAAPIVKVRHLGLYVDAALLDVVRSGCIDDAVWSDLLTRAKGLAWTAKGLHSESEDEASLRGPSSRANIHDGKQKGDEGDQVTLSMNEECDVGGSAGVEDVDQVTWSMNEDCDVGGSGGADEGDQVTWSTSENCDIGGGDGDDSPNETMSADNVVHCKENLKKSSGDLSAEVFEGPAIVDAIRSCSAVLGMHPDQATEPLVDLALWLDVPFAVVPCCVYSKLFPKRALKDGTPVRSHALLVQYLLEKDSRIRVSTLDFEGKNTVLYFDPRWTKID